MAIHSAILKKHFEKVGFNDDFFKVYESEAADKMQNVDEMCDKLYDIKEKHIRMVIYTDFDVDGIMSGVIAYAGFSELGFNVSLFKPTPADGYGFRVKDVDNIIAEFPDTSVIFTGDVGISCNDAIVYAKSKGITVLVTDHHISTEPSAADIAVNPNQYGETYSHNGICGSYVIYKLLEVYTKRYCSPCAQADIYRLQVFAGIATVSDVMPLLFENRQLVRTSVAIARYFFGYELKNGSIAPPVYSPNYAHAFVGLKKLLEYFQEKKKIKTSDDIDEQFYGFYLVPFLNSCKRMDGDMRGVYDIFFSDYIDPLPGYDSMSCVMTGIRYMEILSDRRKVVTEESYQALLAEKEEGITDNSRYMNCEVYIANIGAGICGLLASRFMNFSGLPTLVLVQNEDGSYIGSGRNPGWLDFSGKLREYGLPISCMGHKEAFGVYVPDKAVLDDYVAFFNEVICSEFKKAVAEDRIVTDTSVVMSYTGAVKHDFMVDTELVRDYLEEVGHYHPFGRAFPEPHFKIAVIPGTFEEKMFGSEKQHIKLVTSDGIEILLFNLALDYEKLKYDNRDKEHLLICSGVFRYDTYDAAEYDNICFFADDIDILEMT